MKKRSGMTALAYPFWAMVLLICAMLSMAGPGFAKTPDHNTAFPAPLQILGVWDETSQEEANKPLPFVNLDAQERRFSLWCLGHL